MECHERTCWTVIRIALLVLILPCAILVLDARFRPVDEASPSTVREAITLEPWQAEKITSQEDGGISVANAEWTARHSPA